MFINNTDEKYRDAKDKVRDIQDKILFEEKMLSDSERFLELWNKERRTPKETQELGSYRVLLDLEIYEPGKVDIHRKKLEELKVELEKQKEEADRLKTDRKIAAANYQLYLDMRPEYEKIIDRKKAEEERQRAEQDQRQKDREVMERYDIKRDSDYRENSQWNLAIR